MTAPRAPHDITDLYLAPVVLAVDRRIEELGALDPEALAAQVALKSDKADWTRDMRKSALLSATTHLIELHHWEASWAARGLRLAHGPNALVLGVPASFQAFIERGA